MEKPLQGFLIAVLVLVGIGFVIGTFQSEQTGDESGEGSRSEPLILIHSYFAEANAYSGSIMTPSLCHSWGSDIEIEDSQPERIKLILTTDGSGAEDCEQYPARKDFTFVIPSSPEAELAAVEVDGTSVEFEIREN